jgi:hypothetical protein
MRKRATGSPVGLWQPGTTLTLLAVIAAASTLIESLR